jgi:hypothetical protein
MSSSARRSEAPQCISGKACRALLDWTAEGGWQRRFYDFNVWTERKRIEKLRYMHRNPVKRGLVLEPEQWRWSSFRSYAYGEAGAVKVNGWEILKMKVRAVGGS